jgi:hypothetical protein
MAMTATQVQGIEALVAEARRIATAEDEFYEDGRQTEQDGLREAIGFLPPATAETLRALLAWARGDTDSPERWRLELDAEALLRWVEGRL